MIVGVLKNFERENQETVSQSDIINAVIQALVHDDGGAGTTVEKAAEDSRKIANVINHLINKENMIMVTQDAKIKNERMLCLNINIDIGNVGGQ